MDRIDIARRTGASGILFVACALASPALAQPATTNMSVSANVTANCTVVAAPVTFNVNTLSGSNVDANGGITVTCTNGTGWTASANAGVGTGASMLTRRMTSAGGNTLNYTLYTSNSYGTVWGDGTGTTGTITGTGTGTAQATTIYGRVPMGQASVPAGSYFDTVQVTVTY